MSLTVVPPRETAEPLPQGATVGGTTRVIDTDLGSTPISSKSSERRRAMHDVMEMS
jgi:hypothetical protein